MSNSDSMSKVVVRVASQELCSDRKRYMVSTWVVQLVVISGEFHLADHDNSHQVSSVLLRLEIDDDAAVDGLHRCLVRFENWHGWDVWENFRVFRSSPSKDIAEVLKVFEISVP